MKLSFMFSDSPDPLETTRRHVGTHIEFPNTALSLPDCEEYILKIGRSAAQLTQTYMFLDCSSLRLKMYPVREIRDEGIPSVAHDFRKAMWRFERWTGSRILKRHLAVLMPVPSPIRSRIPQYRGKGDKSLHHYLLRPNAFAPANETEGEYLQNISDVANCCLYLLNSDQTDEAHAWKFAGFHPFWIDKAAITRANKAAKKRIAAENRLTKQKQKLSRLMQESSPDGVGPSQLTPQPRSGRGYGAQPGVFKGVMMRSQLEIRCAAELEARGIAWVYEPERLGKEQYLVDFYLPELQCWIEVKASLEARDTYQLPGVASYLLKERKQPLFVYFPRKGYIVTEKGFEQISHQSLWELLASRKPQDAQ